MSDEKNDLDAALEADLEQARQIANQPGTSILPDDWDAWDVYLPHQYSGPVTASTPVKVPEKQEKIEPKYSDYIKQKTEEYYDKYILD